MGTTIERQRLLECSFDIDDEIKSLVKSGVGFQDDVAISVAFLALKRYVPEMLQWGSERVAVEAEQCFSIDGEEVDRYQDVAFSGNLGRISLQQLNREETLESGIEFATTSYDLCMVFTPTILDPDPVDLVFGREILVPLSYAQTLSR
jgi:hypothetical protein